MNRNSGDHGRLPVTFSHWLHRIKYTCRVCHYELNFEMVAGTTEISEAENRNGNFCGACHNGIFAFGHTEENCNRCHSGDINSGKEKFKKLSGFPRTPYGNKINWVSAFRLGLIKPSQSILEDNYKAVPFNKKLTLDAGWTMIPPAYFDHKIHNEWLDCANCHPDIFNVKRKTTKHFTMDYNLKGKFCGPCHGKVAFPMNFCRPCHPKIKS